MKNAKQTEDKMRLVRAMMEFIKGGKKTILEIISLEGMTKSRATIYADEMMKRGYLSCAMVRVAKSKKRGVKVYTWLSDIKTDAKPVTAPTVNRHEHSDNPFRNYFNLIPPVLTAKSRVVDGFRPHTYPPRKHRAMGVQWTGSCSLGSF